MSRLQRLVPRRLSFFLRRVTLRLALSWTRYRRKRMERMQLKANLLRVLQTQLALEREELDRLLHPEQAQHRQLALELETEQRLAEDLQEMLAPPPPQPVMAQPLVPEPTELPEMEGLSPQQVVEELSRQIGLPTRPTSSPS